MFGSLVLNLLLGASLGAAESKPPSTTNTRLIVMGNGLINPKLRTEDQAAARLEQRLALRFPERRYKVIILPEAPMAERIRRIDEIRALNPDAALLWRSTASLPRELVAAAQYRVDWDEGKIYDRETPVPENQWSKFLARLTPYPAEDWNRIFEYREILKRSPSPRYNLQDLAQPLLEQTSLLAGHFRVQMKIPFTIFLSPNIFYSRSGLFPESWWSRRISGFVLPNRRFRPRLIRRTLDIPGLPQKVMPEEARELYTEPNLQTDSEDMLNATGAEKWAEIVASQLD